MRATDTVARLGGDEFAIVLSGVEDDSVVDAAAERVLRAFEAPFLVGGEPLTLGASVGRAVWPDDAAEIEALMRHADAEMYRAKRGRAAPPSRHRLPPMSYRSGLPQLEGELFLTDGGIETTLIFHQGLDLPAFAAFVLLADEAGTDELRRYYAPYVELARDQGVGLVLESPTWRASPRWAAELGYDEDALDAAQPQGDRADGGAPRRRGGHGGDQRLHRPPGRRIQPHHQAHRERGA